MATDHIADHDRYIDERQRVRDAIAAALRQHKRPVRASEVQGVSPVQVGKCVDHYPSSFIRVYGLNVRSIAAPNYIGWHHHIRAYERDYDEWGHIPRAKVTA